MKFIDRLWYDSLDGSIEVTDEFGLIETKLDNSKIMNLKPIHCINGYDIVAC